MKLTPEKLTLFKMLCITAVCFGFLFVWVTQTYLDSVTPKTTDYYRQQTFENCVGSIELNGIFKPGKDQVLLCQDVARGIFHEEP